jgi:sugar phosphate isomerase/epimerase
MLTIGFSTGALARGDFEQGLRLLEAKHVEAVELSALRYIELRSLLEKLPQHLEQLKKRYRYISFHAPTDFEDEQGLIEQLTMVVKLGWNIVVHPDSIRERSLWRSLGSFLCLENMDSRKKTGRTAEELHEFFQDIPQAKMCFDIAHARQVDPTMTEAARILQEFSDRLAQVHLSEVDGRGVHFAMSLSAELAYEQFSSLISTVPVILESIVDAKDIESEIDKTRMLFAHCLGSNSRTKSTRSSHFRESKHIAGE